MKKGKRYLLHVKKLVIIGYTFQPTQAKFSINFGVGNEHIYYYDTYQKKDE